MYEPWSSRGVDELKQPTYVIAFIEATVGIWDSNDRASVAAVAVRRGVEYIVSRCCGDRLI